MAGTFGIKRFLVSFAVAAIVATSLLAGTAAAAPGPYYEAIGGCSNTSTVLSMTASANAQPAFTKQWISAQFAFRNIDTRGAFVYTPWSNFQNKSESYGYPGVTGMNVTSSPGSTTLSYTVSRGHYEVWVRYTWWNGSAWTDMTGWSKSNTYGYDMYISGVNFPQTLSGSCPVGI
jgi:hypothetical protein